MKIAIVADAHFRGKKLQDKRLAWEQAVRKMIDLEIDMLILAGDTFDTRNIGSRYASTGTVLEAFTTPLKTLTDRDIEVIAIKGNGVHEGTNGDQKSPIEVFTNTKVKVAQGLNHFPVGDVNLYFIPWLEDQDRDEQLKVFLRYAKDDKFPAFKLIVGHLTVKGCTLNNGTVMQGGGEFEVAPEDLEATGADLIALGHIHKRQKIGEKIWYVGALSQDSFGDEGNPQGFMLVDTEKRMHEFIDIDAPKYFTIDDAPVPNPFHTEDYIKYRFKEPPENYDEIAALPNTTIEIVPERDIITREVEGIEAGRSDEDLLRAWLVQKDYTPDDIERIVKEAREISEGVE
jgi:DNA repair exonuclease SbcCD nuclease subunit